MLVEPGGKCGEVLAGAVVALPRRRRQLDGAGVEVEHVLALRVANDLGEDSDQEVLVVGERAARRRADVVGRTRSALDLVRQADIVTAEA